ncbi:MAG: ATP-binding protein [Candidatus Gastranaerophilales bacterium]|nr:ATP-binding protein [Candidatus Gastranaerophilales bacterium]
MKYKNRNIINQLTELIKTRPLTYLNGGRQVGKSTLCSHLPEKINHITFDSPLILTSAKSAPETFINSLSKDVLNVIDEVQFAPEIFPYLKMQIDKNRLEGNTKQRFLLTGSANLMALPKLSEALVGRMSILTLYPFSVSEYQETNVSLFDRLFNDELSVKTYDSYNIIDAIKSATYPEIAIDRNIDRIKWFDSYLTTILNRDIKSLSDLKNPDLMVVLLSLLSMRTGGLINNTEIAKEIGIDYRTYEKMFAFAINSFIVFNVKPWAKPNKLNKRFVKSPKLYFTDCNFLSYIMKRSLDDLFANDTRTFGHVFENFVATELVKCAKFNNLELSHYRTQAGKEADFVLENTNGDIVGIEVKLSTDIDKKYLSGLQELQELSGDKFKRGLIVYTGQAIIPLADKIWAVPVCHFWK